MIDKVWLNEPDQLTFKDEDTNYECLIKRNDYFGFLNGYVVIDKNHIAYKKDYNSPFFDKIIVHEGLSFSGFLDNKWLLGFDCGQCIDYYPYNHKNLSPIPRTYKNINFVKNELKILCIQLQFLNKKYN